MAHPIDEAAVETSGQSRPQKFLVSRRAELDGASRAGRADAASRAHRAVARRRGQRPCARGPLPASRRAPVARLESRRPRRLLVSRHRDRRRRHGRCGCRRSNPARSKGSAAVHSYPVRRAPRRDLRLVRRCAPCRARAARCCPRNSSSDEWSSFLCTAHWRCNYRYAIENVMDPMHGAYLHAALAFDGARRQDRGDARRRDADRLHLREGRAARRQFRLGRMGRKRRAVDAARHSLSQGCRPRRQLLPSSAS